MKKLKGFIFFSLMIIYVPVQLFLFAGEGNDIIKEFEFTDDGIIIISLETYQKRDGYTPVTLFINGVSAGYRLDGSGRVTGWYDSKNSRETFTLDKSESKLIINKNSYPMTCYEKNPIRTRFRLKTGEVPLLLGLNRETNKGWILFGEEKKKIAEFDVLFKTNQAGYEELILPGQCHEDLVYNPSVGTITRVYKKDSSGNIQKGKAWAQRVGPEVFKEVKSEK